MNGENPSPPMETARPIMRVVTAWIWIVAALYLPTVFGFFAPCDHCQKVWLFAWPILPGGMLAMLVQQIFEFRLPDWGLWTAGALVTVLILIGLVRIRRLGRMWFAVILGIAAVLNFLGALGAYGLIRA